MKTYVIAECGSSHDGDMEQAIALVHAAKEAGADCAKFQYWSDPGELAQRRNAPELTEMYSRFKMPAEWMPALLLACRTVGLEFACTSFLPQDVHAVARIADVLKIASFECEAEDLLSAHIPYAMAGKRILISLGMGAHAGAAHRFLVRPVMASEHRDWSPDYLLCVSAYPAPLMDLNLRRFNARLVAGFSDHSVAANEWTGALAVAAGATIVERHLCLPETARDNPERPHAMEPDCFKRYVDNIRYAEVVAGDEHHTVQPSERASLRYRVGVAPVPTVSEAFSGND